MLFVANWPASRITHWDSLLMARAIENQCYVVGVNRIGTDINGIAYNGNSSVYDFYGNCVTLAGNSHAVATATLSKVALQQYKQQYPFWQDADNFTIHD